MSSSIRVVSLVPSLSETARAWGVDPVACSRYCEQDDLPHVGGTKNPDIEAIVELAPDVVLLDKVENRKEDAEALTAAGLELFVSNVRTMTDVAPDLDRLASVLKLSPQTGDWPDLAGIQADPPSPVARCFVPIWRRPWMAIGPDTYGSTLLESIGLANVFTDAEVEYPEIELTDPILAGADRVLAPSEPYEFTAEHLVELEVVGPVTEVDGQDLFWWGVRTPAAIERLRTALRPG